MTDRPRATSRQALDASASRPAALPSLGALRAFDLAAQLGSFKHAAAALGVTATAISHAVRGLEAELGQPLFERRTRAVVLAPAGQALHASVRDGFALIAAGVERVRVVRPVLTLSTTPAFAAKWLVPRLARLHAVHPALELRIHASNEPVVLRTGVYDLAIRYGSGPYPRATHLFDDRFAVVASPRLRVRSVAEVLRQPRIEFDWHRALPRELTWRAWLRAAGVKADQRGPSATTRGTRYSDESHAIQAAVAGQGVALLSEALVREELRLGALRVCPGPVLEGLGYYVLRPEDESVAAGSAADAVAQWLVDEARRDARSA